MTWRARPLMRAIMDKPPEKDASRRNARSSKIIYNQRELGPFMAKPVLLTGDDDAEELRPIQRDLPHQYADRYRVLRANSGQFPLDTLRQLKTRTDPVALFLPFQRIPPTD